jgi:hypothetical protein
VEAEAGVCCVLLAACRLVFLFMNLQSVSKTVKCQREPPVLFRCSIVASSRWIKARGEFELEVRDNRIPNRIGQYCTLQNSVPPLRAKVTLRHISPFGQSDVVRTDAINTDQMTLDTLYKTEPYKVNDRT